MRPRPNVRLVASRAAVIVGAILAGCALAASGATAAHAGDDGARPSQRGGLPASADAGRLSLIVEPGQGFAAIDRDVGAAQRSVDVTMYELDDTRFEAALAADTRRGIKVRVLLNGGYFGRGGFSPNDAAVRYLRANGVAVRASPAAFALTHQKTITIDGRTSLVMTLNLTSRYYATDRDFAVIDTQPADVAAIERVFDADWKARPIVPSGGTGDLVWSPGAQNEQVSLIDSARTSLDIENEEMADSSITSALCAAARRRVQVRVVMSDEEGWHDAFDELVACGVAVRTYAPEAPLYIHAKEIVVDAREAFVGSQNFSWTSLQENRELGIVISDRAILSELVETFEDDYRGASPFGL